MNSKENIDHKAVMEASTMWKDFIKRWKNKKIDLRRMNISEKEKARIIDEGDGVIENVLDTFLTEWGKKEWDNFPKWLSEKEREIDNLIQEIIQRSMTAAVIEKVRQEYAIDDTKALREVSEIWKQYFCYVVQFKDLYNRFPKQKEMYGEYPLGRWCRWQRERYKENKLHAIQIELLESIGFEWSAQLPRKK